MDFHGIDILDVRNCRMTSEITRAYSSGFIQLGYVNFVFSDTLCSFIPIMIVLWSIFLRRDEFNGTNGVFLRPRIHLRVQNQIDILDLQSNSE